MKSLLSKELYQLKPIAWLLAGLTLLSIFETVWSKRIDEFRFSAWCDVFCQPGTPIDYGISLMIIVMIVAYSLFPTEHDESTIDFLHALPVTRATIFFSKFTAGFMLLVVLIIIDYSVSALLLSANTQSIDGKFYPNIFGRQMLLEAVFAFVMLSHGLLMSWFRWLGLIIYAVYLIALMTLETVLGGVGALSVFSILQIDIAGQSLQLAWRNIAVHGVVALVLLYISYLLWSRDHRISDTSTGNSRGRWVTVLFTLALFALAALLMVYQSSSSLNEEEKAGFKTVSTKHYRFVATEDASERLQQIVKFADADYQVLISMLAMQQQPTIQADMTSNNKHALGVASWKKVRMNIGGFESDREYRRILSHETTHALQSVESDRKLSSHYNATKFFIEGMAQYTSFVIVPNAELRSSNWRLAAVAWARQGIEFTDVIDFSGFKDRFDENLVYTLGDIWAQAMVDACSERVLGDLLRSFRNDVGAGAMASRELWRQSLSHSQCNLETVIDQWEILLQDTFASIQEQEFPVYSEPLIEHDTHAKKIRVRVNIGVDLQSTEAIVLPENYHLKIRGDTQLGQIPDAVYHGRLLSQESQPTVEFIVPANVARQGRVRYQLGYVPTAGRRIYFERWRRGSIL